MNEIIISEVNVVPIPHQNGLVGFSSVIINHAFKVDNIAILSSPGSKLGFRVQYPTKKLSSGRVVSCFFPINQAVGEIVSDAIVRKYIELMGNFNHIYS